MTIIRKCKKCKHWSKIIGCLVFRRLMMIHIGRERATYREPFPKISMPKGVCKDIKKAWRLEERR